MELTAGYQTSETAKIKEWFSSCHCLKTNYNQGFSILMRYVQHRQIQYLPYMYWTLLVSPKIKIRHQQKSICFSPSSPKSLISHSQSQKRCRNRDNFLNLLLSFLQQQSNDFVSHRNIPYSHFLTVLEFRPTGELSGARFSTQVKIGVFCWADLALCSWGSGKGCE